LCGSRQEKLSLLKIAKGTAFCHLAKQSDQSSSQEILL
jgi:hypothetical protein